MGECVHVYVHLCVCIRCSTLFFCLCEEVDMEIKGAMNNDPPPDEAMYLHMTISKTRDVLPIDSTTFFYGFSNIVVTNHGMKFKKKLPGDLLS